MCHNVEYREAVALHSPGSPRSGAPWEWQHNTTNYAEGVTQGFAMLRTNYRVTDWVRPLRGVMRKHVPDTQGALRDPGLWSETPSALNRQVRRQSPPRRALTLIEVVASTMIVGLMAVAALNALGAAMKSANSIGNRAVAAGMADELMSEITMQSYSDPDGSPVFGHESGESTGVRSAFDDVDDYHGWNASPPQYRDGTTIPDRTNWRQRVTITYVAPANLTTTSATDQGVKRIHVQIEYQNTVLADQYAVRTNTDQ